MISGYKKWKFEYVEKAFQLALLGVTDQVLAVALDVPVRTIDFWKVRKPEFAEAIRKGRIEADAKVAKAIYKDAIGFEYEEEQVVIFRGTAKKIRVKKYSKPNSQAGLRWLSLRQREQWAEVVRAEVKHTNININKIDLTGLSMDELKLMESIHQKQLGASNASGNN